MDKKKLIRNWHRKKFVLNISIIILIFLSILVVNANAASNAVPTIPTTIKVYRTATGTIDVIDFKTYVKNVLPNEWYPSWNSNSLKVGAIAAKTYAWYWIINHEYPGQGFDVVDTSEDQVYIPNSRLASTDQAVDDTWNYVMTKNDQIFMSQYDSGSRGGPDPNNPGRLSQWGSLYWAQKGYDWQWILHYYYDPIVINAIDNNGSIYSTSNPTGAEIYLNNIDKIVQTNVTLVGISPGTYTLTYKKSGYQDCIVNNVGVTAGQVTNPPICSMVPIVLNTNLLQNPGFENSTIISGMPDNWLKYPNPWNSTAKLTYPEVGNDGSKAVGISQTNAGSKQSLIQPVNIIADTNYTVGGYVNTDISTGSAVIGIDWFTSSGTYISSNIIYLGGTNPWANKIATVKSPSNAAKANFYVGLFGTGKAIFSNMLLKIS